MTPTNGFHPLYREPRVDYLLDWPWILPSLCTRHARPGSPRFREIAQEPPGGLGFVLWAVEPGVPERSGAGAPAPPER